MVIVCPYDVDRVLYRTLISRGTIQIMPGNVDRFQFNYPGVNNDMYDFIQFLFGFEEAEEITCTNV